MSYKQDLIYGQQNEERVFKYLKDKKYTNLKKSGDRYSHYDFIDEEKKVLIELKSIRVKFGTHKYAMLNNNKFEGLRKLTCERFSKYKDHKVIVYYLYSEKDLYKKTLFKKGKQFLKDKHYILKDYKRIRSDYNDESKKYLYILNDCFVSCPSFNTRQ